MKKHIFLAAALAGGFFLAQPEAKAQGAYVKLGGAYNFGVASEIGYNYDYNLNWNGIGSPSSYSQTYEGVNVNFGKGITAGATAGYMFNKNFGAELGIGYLIGGKNELKETNKQTGNSHTEKSEISSRMLLLQPALVVSAGMESINPYVRFGVVAAKGKVTETYTMTNNSDKYDEESELSGSWGIGFQGGIGAEFKLSDNLAFYSELTTSNLNYSPEKGEITKATFNGQDVLGELTTREKETEFVDKITDSSHSNEPESEPHKSLKSNMPFSSIGVGLGIKMNF